MEFINPSAEIWEQGTTLEDMWKHIARCTRVCYQSTPIENGETDEEFVKRVIIRHFSKGELDKMHGAMLEHGTVYLFIPWLDDVNTRLPEVVKHYCNNPYSKENYTYDDNPGSYITTNLRVIYENGWLDDLKYVCTPTEHHARRVTVSFITNIGVSRELNRHRVNSIAEESTRYCNYNKRNNGQINIGIPAWFDNDVDKSYLKGHQFDSIVSYCDDICTEDDGNWGDIDYYLFALTAAEFSYNKLIKKGWTPQQAREVLPLATKTQLIHTAFIDDWKHFFALRADGVSGRPHPNVMSLIKPLKDEFIKRQYI
jgi:thymidylate synthase (FAD)